MGPKIHLMVQLELQQIHQVSDNVFKITPGGTITEIIDGTGDGAGNSLNAPFNVATDSSGNVFVAGKTSDNVFKIELDLGTVGDPIDGTDITINTTALLVEGIYTNTLWIILVIGGIAGLVIFILKRSR